MSAPTIGLLCGSGLADVIVERMDARNTTEHHVDTPFGAPSDAIIEGTVHDTRVLILKRHGPGHLLNPTAVPYRANVFALKTLGCTHVVASGATGSLREDVEPGHVVLCDQFIDRTVARPRTFFEHAAVHVEFADPCCPVTRKWLRGAAKRAGDLTLHDIGTYVCIEGPTFSTQAESHMFRTWGADVVGMTALPEARLCREAELAYALIALPTDYDCWRPRDPGTTGDSLVAEIIGNLGRATDECLALLLAALADVAPLAHACPAHDALKMAIWSNKEAIDPTERERLAPLWGRWFE